MSKVKQNTVDKKIKSTQATMKKTTHNVVKNLEKLLKGTHKCK